MRILFAALATVIAASAADTASAEILYPWCRQPAEGGNNCGFTTLAQCQDASTGRAAFCIENPRYQAPAKSSAPKGRR